MSDQPTCGVLYQQALEQFTGMNPRLIPLWASGFVAGQAEKCYLGACRAAMFRPSPEWNTIIESAVKQACSTWDLRWLRLDAEWWIYRPLPDVLATFERLEQILRNGQENCPEWHRLRGMLCGVPWNEVDVAFHERPGYGEPADRKVTL